MTVTEDVLYLSETRINNFECFQHKEMINDELNIAMSQNTQGGGKMLHFELAQAT